MLRMTRTKTLSAVFVWLRASERISVKVLAWRICVLLRQSLIPAIISFRPDIFTRRGIGIIRGEVAWPRCRAECNGRKIGPAAIAFRAADELNDFCAHKSPSHIVIATRPANASDIR
jgi:hypothetical protein